VNEPLQLTLVDAADFLQDHGVAYALIDGLAASLRGQARLTADVDLVMACDVSQALALVEALNASQFMPLFEGVAEVVERSFILPLRHRTTGVKVDLALGLSGFEQLIIQRATLVELGGRDITVAKAEDLIVMKSLAGRPQDDQDLRGIVIAQGDRLDWDYCLRVAADLEESIGQSLVQSIRDLRARYA
jgi:Nucleotidyl transferase of unknown function (DUF2204)